MFLNLAWFFVEHGVVALHHWSVKGPRHAFANVRWRCCGSRVGQAGLLISKLLSRRNGLIGRGGHVEQHFSQVGASCYAANVGVDGFAPT